MTNRGTPTRSAHSVLRRQWLGSPAWHWVVAVGLLFAVWAGLEAAQNPLRPFGAPTVPIGPAGLLLYAGLAAASGVAAWAATVAWYRWTRQMSSRGGSRAAGPELPP